MRFVSAAVLLVGLTSGAHAQPATDLTREFQAGVDAYRLGKLDEAREHLDKAKALDPKLPGPNRFLAAVAQAQGRWQDCIDAARLAIELNPRSAEIADTRKLHDDCRIQAGRTPYRDELGDSAAIAVVTNVPGATVKIGGLTYGGTPLAPRPITAGTLQVDIAKAGWKPVHLEINALGGIVTDITVDLEPDPAAQSAVDLNIKKLDRHSNGWLIVEGGGEITVDGAAVATPPDGKLELSPGTHVIEVRRPSQDPWRRRVRILAAQKLTVAPVLVDTASREHDEHLGIALVGGGAAIAVFGFASALISSHAALDAREIQRVESARTPGPIDQSVERLHTRAEFEDARSRAKSWRLISTVSYSAALLAVGGGAVLMYLGGRERSDVPPPFAVSPVTGGAVVSTEMRW